MCCASLYVILQQLSPITDTDKHHTEALSMKTELNNPPEP